MHKVGSRLIDIRARDEGPTNQAEAFDNAGRVIWR